MADNLGFRGSTQVQVGTQREPDSPRTRGGAWREQDSPHHEGPLARPGERPGEERRIVPLRRLAQGGQEVSSLEQGVKGA